MGSMLNFYGEGKTRQFTYMGLLGSANFYSIFGLFIDICDILNSYVLFL